MADGRRSAFPARIHALLARDAPVAVVLRKGPSKLTCALRWDRRTDAITVGQWLKGRIYAHRCDIAPDGRHWLYFALDGHWRSAAKGSYTVLARVPWLKALHLWPQGDTWGGGGLFVDRERFTAFTGGVASVHAPATHLPGVSITDEPWFAGPIYPSRLLRDGWTRLADDTFARDAGRGWSLRKTVVSTLDRAPGRGIPYEEHALVHDDGRILPFPAWEWADVDGRRLVWASAGGLHAGNVDADGLVGARLLHDLDPLRFEPIAAPY